MTRFLPHLAFLLGLAALGWIGAGYLGGHGLALAVTAVIAAFYLAGGLELRRFRADTLALSDRLADLKEPPAQLDHWLAGVPPSLRGAVRLRIEGERVGLPGPALTPYLVGLLVLLGMLGTFLGMVVTLDGTGSALASATDVQAIRASLAAPVRGLGLAFGTSIAGVAASAMLGLASALCRRDRQWLGQELDARIAGPLHGFTPAHRREASFGLLEQQAQALPRLVDRIEALGSMLEREQRSLQERLGTNQERFHEHATQAYAELARSVDRSLKESLAESARGASAAIRPVVEATMAAIAREASGLHGRLEEGVTRQLLGMTESLEDHAGRMGELWRGALADHRRHGESMGSDLRDTLGHFSQTFAQRSSELVDGVAARLAGSLDQVGRQWDEALARHTCASEANAADTRRALAGATDSFERQTAALLQGVDHSHAASRREIAAADAQRLDAWATAMDALSSRLHAQWQQAGAEAAQHQQALCETLAATARELGERTGSQARDTIAEVARLVDVAAQAPRAAAEVIAELRERLSAGMARDHEMLEERARLLGGLRTALDALTHASTAQRGAIDALVSSSAELMDRVSSRFTDTLDAESGRMETLAAQLAGSAVEVASLGEAFGLAVQLFGQSTDKLGAQLQRIEVALAKSTARSDEQLAYYVAQARELIDLSISSQKQIVDDLQQLARRREAAASPA